MDESEAEFLEGMLDTYLDEAVRLVSYGLDDDEVAQTADTLAFTAKVWLRGFLFGLMVAVRTRTDEAGKITEEDQMEIIEMVEEREDKVSEMLLNRADDQG